MNKQIKQQMAEESKFLAAEAKRADRSYTKADLSKAARIVQDHFNCCSAGAAVVRKDAERPDIFAPVIEVEVYGNHENVVDHLALVNMFQALKKAKLVGKDTGCCWLGFRKGQLFVWWVAGN